MVCCMLASCWSGAVPRSRESRSQVGHDGILRRIGMAIRLSCLSNAEQAD